VFVIGSDPVMFGIVDSLNRPGGNITGITLIASETVAKRLELLLELVPTAARIGVLTNVNNPITKPQITELQAAVRALGRDIRVLNASTESDFEPPSQPLINSTSTRYWLPLTHFLMIGAPNSLRSRLTTGCPCLTFGVSSSRMADS
jgi:ABC-type uncharacterized transport system substrate-binding protein